MRITLIILAAMLITSAAQAAPGGKTVTCFDAAAGVRACAEHPLDKPPKLEQQAWPWGCIQWSTVGGLHCVR